MRFNYQARTKQGDIQTGVIEAGNHESAVKILQGHDLAVISLQAESKVPFYARSLKLFQKVKNKELVMFYRQLAILFDANIPPLESLKAIATQVPNPYFKNILFEIENDVRGGENLSSAMAKHKKVFSSFYINVIKSGEATGKLSEVLKYLADYAEDTYKLNQKIKGAFTYPAFILSAFVLIAVLLLVYVVPQLTQILTETGAELPITTKLLIWMSKIIRKWVWLLALILGGATFGFLRYIKTSNGRRRWDEFKLKIPVLGKLFRKIYITRFAENFSTLLKGGLPILKALKISGQVIGNTVYSDLIDQAVEEVKKGGHVSSVFEKDKKIIPPLVVQMLKVGEETAKIDSILEKLADFYQDEVSRTVDNLTQLIEPALIIVLGAGVGFLVASILMPIYNVTSGGF